MSEKRIIELLEQIKELQIIQNQLTEKILEQNERVQKETTEAASRVRASTDRLIKRTGLFSLDNIAIIVFLLLVLAWLYYKT